MTQKGKKSYVGNEENEWIYCTDLYITDGTGGMRSKHSEWN